MKKIICIILAVLIAIYLVATLYIYHTADDRICKEVAVVITDSVERKFINSADIIAYLKKNNRYPIGKKVKNINTDEIEKSLLKNEIIDKAEVVQKISGNINIVISQKMPILRVFSAGASYYVDEEGRTMPTLTGMAIYVPVASGNIDKKFATNELYQVAKYLRKDPFWDAQIEQLYVHSPEDVEIVPRVGGHRILLGSLDDFETKLQKLRLFYEQVTPKMGWNKYSIINLKYRNQIVCTKNKEI
jgi:cell division protein FtsQ